MRAFGRICRASGMVWTAVVDLRRCRGIAAGSFRRQTGDFFSLRATVVPCADDGQAPMVDWSLTSLQLKLIHCLAGDARSTEKEDRRACRASRPRHHFPAGRGGRHRPNGARRPRRHPPITSAPVMCMTTIYAKNEPKRQDRSVGCAENTAPGPEHSGFAA